MKSLELHTTHMPLRRLAVLALLVLAGASASAQVNTIAFNQFMGTYTDLPNPTNIPLTGGTDDAIYAVTLPFSFPFNGKNYTVVYPCTNGYVVLPDGVTAPSPYMYPNPMSDSYYACDAVMVVWGGDLDGKTTGTLSYQVQGTAPYRTMTIQWKNWNYWSSTYAGNQMNFQIRFYETSGQIEYIYGPITTGSSTTAVYVGMRGTSNTDYHSRTITSGDWVNSLRGSANTSSMAYNASTKPQTGLIYRWGCYLDASKYGFDIVDAQMNHLSLINTPTTANFHFYIGFPAEAFTATATLNFYLVGGSPLPAYTTVLNLNKPLTDLDAVVSVNIPQLPSGFYRIEMTLMTKNSCSVYESMQMKTSTLALQADEVACIVWPGDVNNDGVVNYGDRSALNKYIFEANLRASWLQGPARYRSDAATNPLAFLTWEAQAGVPWATADGCYMDTDGNGMVNNLDQIGIKMNFLRSHISAPKTATELSPTTFDMSQNYPNPFNPSTTLRVNVPESSIVTLTVSDMLGRTVATLVNGRLETGTHTITFDGAQLESGVYVATVTMNGLGSGLSFSKTVKMTLTK